MVRLLLSFRIPKRRRTAALQDAGAHAASRDDDGVVNGQGLGWRVAPWSQRLRHVLRRSLDFSPLKGVRRTTITQTTSTTHSTAAPSDPCLVAVLCGKVNPLGHDGEPEQDRGKAEWRAEGADPRVATANFTPEEYAGQALFQQVYCAREECRHQPSRTARFGSRTSLVGLDGPS